MTTSQIVGCMLFGFVIAGSIMATQRSPDIRHMLMVIWTFFVILCGAATAWKEELILLIWYIVTLDLIELIAAGIQVSVPSPKLAHCDRFITTDLRDACVFWYPLYSIVAFILPEYPILHWEALFYLNLFLMWYAYQIFWIRSTAPSGALIIEVLGGVISTFGAAGMSLYASWRIYLYLHNLDWGWFVRFINSVL